MDPKTLEQIIGRQSSETADERAARRILIVLIVGFGVLVIGLGLFAYRTITVNAADKARFMSQCMQDHKEYECIYLWRSSERPGPDVIPIPIPIPTR